MKKGIFARRMLSLLLCGAVSVSMPMPPVMAAKAELEEHAETGAAEAGSSSLIVKGNSRSEGGVIRIGKDGCVTFQNEFENIGYRFDSQTFFLGWIENEGQLIFENNFINGFGGKDGAVDNRGQITLKGKLQNGTILLSDTYFKSTGQFTCDDTIYNFAQMEIKNGTIRGEIQNEDELTLQNCTISGGITATDWSSNVEIKDCRLDGIIDCTGGQGEDNYAALKIDNTLLSDTSYTQIKAQYANVTITGGKYRWKDDGNGFGGIVLLKDGSLEIGEGADISSAGVPIRLFENAKLTLNGGRITNSSESGESDLDRLAIFISPCEELPAQLGQIRTQLQSTLENGAVLGISSDGGISRTYKAEQEGDHWNLVEIGESLAEVTVEAELEEGVSEAIQGEGFLPEDTDAALADGSDQATEDSGEEQVPALKDQEPDEETDSGQDSVNPDKATDGDEAAGDDKVTGNGEGAGSEGTDSGEAENPEEEKAPSQDQDALLPEEIEDKKEEEAAKDGGADEKGEAEAAENGAE